MPKTYDPLATTTLTSTASTVTFSSFSSTYTDLVLVINGIRELGSYVDLAMRFNNDTASNYYATALYATSAIGNFNSGALDKLYIDYYSGPNNAADTHQIVHIFNYNNTNVKKTTLMMGANPARPGIERMVGFWNSTSAITRIDILPLSGNWGANTMVSLYGIKQA